MQTADLISRLSEEGGQLPRRGAPARLLVTLAFGCAASFIIMWWWLGIRPDLAEAMRTSSYWMKFAYTLALAAFSFWLAERLGRPAAPTRRPARMLLVPVVGLLALALLQLAKSAALSRMHLVMGASAQVCPWRIVALSLPILAAGMYGLRQLAPTRLVATGTAVGLLAGAAGAWIYAFHCDESAAPFVAVWYTFGIAIVGALGAASGKWLLRW